DDRRRRERARNRGEGRLDAGLPPLALEGLDETRLLAADVGAGAAVDGNVERERGSEDLLAEETLRVRLADGLLEDARAVVELAADVDVGGAAPDRVGSQDHSLEQLMGVVLHEEAVLERPGLRLVGVAEEVDGLALRVLRQEAPLDSGREAGAAAAPDVRLL